MVAPFMNICTHRPSKTPHALPDTLENTCMCPSHTTKLCSPQYSVALSDLGQLFFWGNMRSTAGRGANKTVYNMPRRFKGLEAIFAVACGEHEVSALVLAKRSH